MRKRNDILFLFFFIGTLALLSSCGEEDYIPKPIGYIRTELPEQHYADYQVGDVLHFDLSDQAKVVVLSKTNKNIRFNIEYPKLKAKVHLAYNTVDNNLNTYLEETRKLTYQHHEKANDIEKIKIKNPAHHTYGIKYNLTGDVASASQFFLTDSTQHFLRGALYFWARPNEDSLAPSVQYLRGDLDRLIETIEWDN